MTPRIEASSVHARVGSVETLKSTKVYNWTAYLVKVTERLSVARTSRPDISGWKERDAAPYWLAFAEHVSGTRDPVGLRPLSESVARAEYERLLEFLR